MFTWITPLFPFKTIQKLMLKILTSLHKHTAYTCVKSILKVPSLKLLISLIEELNSIHENNTLRLLLPIIISHLPLLEHKRKTMLL